MTPTKNQILFRKTTYFQQSKNNQKVEPTITQSHQQQKKHKISLILIKKGVDFNAKSTITNQSKVMHPKFISRL